MARMFPPAKTAYAKPLELISRVKEMSVDVGGIKNLKMLVGLPAELATRPTGIRSETFRHVSAPRRMNGQVCCRRAQTKNTTSPTTSVPAPIAM
jgi:hypothetical protein